MQGQIENIALQGMVSTVPCHDVCNLDYVEQIKDRRIKKQIQLTGIDRRRVTVGNQKASDLAAIAASDLLERLDWDANDIDALIFVTQSPELLRPSTAFLIQERLGIGKQCMAYDINQGCSGFVVGLITLSGILQLTKGKGLLLVGESNAAEGEGLHRNALLEGDAGAAVALEYSEGAPLIEFLECSDGSRADLLFTNRKNRGYMDGNAVLLFGLTDVADEIKSFLRRESIRKEETDFYVLHQAQKLIVDGIVQETGIPEDRVLMSCKNFGNTSSASIPLTCCTEIPKTGASGVKNILMSGFGIGLSWGILYVRMDVANIFPLIESDYAYNDMDKFDV